MRESPSRYTAKISLQDVNDAHVLAIGRVPANSSVLDLGAADGSVARVLKGLGCRVWGVEIDPVAADLARSICEEVVVGDLQTLDMVECFANQQFDVVLLLDILEHLSDPVSVLEGLKPILADGGWAVISLPNVAHTSLRLSLLEGRFTYTDTGLLDRTHLRFFDRAGVDDLLASAGWGMFDLVRVTRRLGTTEITIDDADPSLVRRLESDPEAYTYQFVISAAPLGSRALAHPPLQPAAVAQSLLLEAGERIAALEDELRRLEEEIEELKRNSLPDLLEQLSAIRESGQIRRGHLKYLLGVLRENTDRLTESLAP